MKRTRAEIEQLVERELLLIADPARRAELQRYLVEPELRVLAWDYGPPDEFECWIVGRRPDGRLDLAYCDDGFGHYAPWGCVIPDEGSMGMDAQWSRGLEAAAIKAQLLRAPRGYEDP